MRRTDNRISRRMVDALEVDKDTVFWDSELTGFGVRVYPTGRKYYVAQTRARGQAPKRVTVGLHGILTPEEARRRAALIISRIKSGEDPVPESLSAKLADSPKIGELAQRWLVQHVELHCKPKSQIVYRSIVNRHLLPAMGKMPALLVDHAKVANLHHSLRTTPVMANDVIHILSRIWNAAENRGELPEGSNPCRRVVKYRQHPRERFLSEAEFRRLGHALAEAEAGKGASVHAVAAIRLLLLTGCRKNEILALRWEDVDLAARELHLRDSKTGARTVALSPEATEVLADIPRIAENPHVIPGQVPGKPMRKLDTPWKAICERAGLEGIRLHDCRHSFASRALALGECLPAIGKLLGHTHVKTTARYAHLAQDSVRESAIRISDSIAADILNGYRPTAAK